MKLNNSVIAIVLLFLSAQPGQAQAFFESTKMRALAPGVGAGLGASMSANKTLKRNFAGMQAATQAAAVSQAKMLQQYYQMGCDYEAKMRWDFAEKAFRYALQVIARQHGPGSPESLTALQHLSRDCKAQKKLDDAIGFQKTIVTLAQKAKSADDVFLLKAQQDLSSLFLDKGDYAAAEPILHDSVGLLKRNKALPRPQLKATLEVYGKVLRQLNRAQEADQLNSAETAVSQPLPQVSPTPAANAPEQGLPTPDVNASEQKLPTPDVNAPEKALPTPAVSASEQGLPIKAVNGSDQAVGRETAASASSAQPEATNAEAKSPETPGQAGPLPGSSGSKPAEPSSVESSAATPAANAAKESSGAAQSPVGSGKPEQKPEQAGTGSVKSDSESTPAGQTGEARKSEPLPEPGTSSPGIRKE